MKKYSNRDPEPPKSGECPELMMLSAFTDGTLTSRDRKKVLEHIRHCRECYTLIVDSISIQRDLPDDIRETEPQYLPGSLRPDSETVPERKRFLSKFGRLQSAALLTPVAALFLITFLMQSGPEWDRNELLSALERDRDLIVISQSLPLEESRSETLGFNKGLSDKQLAFKVGTLLSRLEISRLAGNQSKTSTYIEQLQPLLNLTHLPSELVEKSDLDSGESLESIESHFLTSPHNFYFKLGMFVESGKAYSLVEKSSLYDKTYFKYLTKQPEFKTLPPGVTRRFKDIEVITAKNSVAKNDETIYKFLQEIQQILL